MLRGHLRENDGYRVAGDLDVCICVCLCMHVCIYIIIIIIIIYNLLTACPITISNTTCVA
jgi:hypothetical protein